MTRLARCRFRAQHVVCVEMDRQEPGTRFPATLRACGGRSLHHPVTAMSCASATTCVAVEYGGDALTYSSGSCRLRKRSIQRRRFTSISCPTTTYCAAIDSFGNLFPFVTEVGLPVRFDPEWIAVPRRIDLLHSATFCVSSTRPQSDLLRRSDSAAPLQIDSSVLAEGTLSMPCHVSHDILRRRRCSGRDYLLTDRLSGGP